MKNLHISGLNLSLLILLSVASWSVPAFSMKSSGATTSMTFAQYISAWNQYEKSVKSGAPEATLLQPIESDLSSVATPNAGALNFIAGKLGVSKDKATDKAAVLAALQVKIAAGGTATGTGSSGSGGGSGTPTPVAPTPVTPAPAPAPTPVTPAPAPAPKVSGAASAPAPAAQDLADLLSKLPNTASWATGTTGEAEFKKLIDDLKAHTGTAASLAAGGGLTPADVANAVAAAEAVKDTAHASAQ
ncbi:MAG TPA: hypothetical protein VJJ81_01395, partial [Candidatus Babeliales bacterium]|nr:hypothetical protein [Candidatus Babeliales bacterium]